MKRATLDRLETARDAVVAAAVTGAGAAGLLTAIVEGLKWLAKP